MKKPYLKVATADLERIRTALENRIEHHQDLAAANHQRSDLKRYNVMCAASYKETLAKVESRL